MVKAATCWISKSSEFAFKFHNETLIKRLPFRLILMRENIQLYCKIPVCSKPSINGNGAFASYLDLSYFHDSLQLKCILETPSQAILNTVRCAICCSETFSLSYSANPSKPTTSLFLSVARLWLFVHRKLQLLQRSFCSNKAKKHKLKKENLPFQRKSDRNWCSCCSANNCCKDN